MAANQTPIESEIATARANAVEYGRRIKRDANTLQKTINDLAKQVIDDAERNRAEQMKLRGKLERKENVIKQLQALLRKEHIQKEKMEMELNKLGADPWANNKEIGELRETVKALKAKNKQYRLSIRNLKLKLDDQLESAYEDDPDEEDGDPSEDSEGAEDTVVGGAEDSEEDEEEYENVGGSGAEATDVDMATASGGGSVDILDVSDGSDPEDSSFELNDREKRKLAKMEAAENDKGCAEMKEEEEEQNDEAGIVDAI